MAKFAGSVGYVTQEETRPGIWQPVATEKKMSGDVIRMANAFSSDGRVTSGKVNDDITLQHRISLIANPYAYENFTKIKYVRWLGIMWKVESVEVTRPRLILSLGGVWNGTEPERETT